MQFHVKKKFDLFDFTSFFCLDFFKLQQTELVFSVLNNKHTRVILVQIYVVGSMTSAAQTVS